LCHYELETIEKCQTTDSDYDFELLIDIRKEASMSKVVQPC